MTTGRHVTFVELAGNGAAARLQALDDLAAQGGARGELLRSTERDELWLLVLRGAAPDPAALPEGARVWRFAVAEGEA